MNEIVPLPALQVIYERATLAKLLDEPGVLAVFGYGSAAPAANHDPRYNLIALEPAVAPAPFEVWRVPGTISCGRQGLVRFATDGNYLFGALELDETDHGGIMSAAAAAYRLLSSFSNASAYPNVLRMWNYFSNINGGVDDAERYKQFCVGRIAGMGDTFAQGFPAATAIGRLDDSPTLQVYWLAARIPGVALENPRQISAYHYPRQYGPTAPSFARAMLAPCTPMQLHISGTAAVVGHASQHKNDVDAQFGEIMTNLDTLLGKAVSWGLPARFGANSALKVYLRRPEYLPIITECIRRQLPADCRKLLLYGDVCRNELLVEIDGIHGAV